MGTSELNRAVGCRLCCREGSNLLLQELAGNPCGAGGIKPSLKGRDGTSKGGRHSQCQEGLRSSGCPRNRRGRRDEREAGLRGWTHSPVGLWARAWPDTLAKQKARLPSARASPSCRQAWLWEKSQPYLPGSWQETPFILGRGGAGGGVWREEGAAHPASEVLLEISPHFLLTPIPSPGRIPHQLPLPLPRRIGSAIPLKGPESELRMRLTQCGRGGP